MCSTFKMALAAMYADGSDRTPLRIAIGDQEDVHVARGRVAQELGGTRHTGRVATQHPALKKIRRVASTIQEPERGMTVRLSFGTNVCSRRRR